LGDAIANVSGSIVDVVEVEAANDDATFTHEHVKRVSPSVLFGQELAVMNREVLKEIVASIADPRREIFSVCSLKVVNGRFVFHAKTLQFEHASSLISNARY
jgi:hypothetical protein